MLADKELNELKNILRNRFHELRETVRLELLKSDQQSYIELAGVVHDLEEQSVADLLVDLGLADIDRHIDEIREIDAALLRIAQRSYGVCSDCGTDIDINRLFIEPTACRCHECQVRHEKNYKQSTHATL